MSCQTKQIKFQLRRATAANWSSTNPILQAGEPGFDISNNCLKIGDGYTPWNSLPYLNSCGGGGGGSTGPTGPTGNQGPTGAGGALGYYGSFFDTQDQTDGVSPTPFQYNTTDIANGISIQNDTQIPPKPTLITFAHSGIYNIQFSAQFHNTGGGGSGNTVNIWLRKNGNNVPDTDTKLTVPSNNPYVVAAWNFLVDVTAGDEYQLMWLTDNSNIIIEYEPSNATHPAIPSIILTVQQVMYTQVGPTGPTGADSVVPGPTGTRGSQIFNGNLGGPTGDITGFIYSNYGVTAQSGDYFLNTYDGKMSYLS